MLTDIGIYNIYIDFFLLKGHTQWNIIIIFYSYL